MPELPEVHTTVTGLNTVIKNKKIIDIWSDFHVGTTHKSRQTIKNKKYFEDFKKIVISKKIKNVERRGKNILIHLSGDYTILVHMKMTGCLMYKKDRNEKYLHLYFSLSNGHYLLFSDLRKFGSVAVVETTKLDSHESLLRLGPEPLHDSFTASNFFEILKNKNSMPIKSALLDQTAVAGIGNIYSDEILFETGVHPLSNASKIPKEKYFEMWKIMRKILNFSIKHGGDSKSDYRNAFGEKGGFQNFHKVYSKRSKKCVHPGCPGIIERVMVRGRSSHYCPVHQKMFK